MNLEEEGRALLEQLRAAGIAVDDAGHFQLTADNLAAVCAQFPLQGPEVFRAIFAAGQASAQGAVKEANS